MREGASWQAKRGPFTEPQGTGQASGKGMAHEGLTSRDAQRSMSCMWWKSFVWPLHVGDHRDTAEHLRCEGPTRQANPGRCGRHKGMPGTGGEAGVQGSSHR